MLTAVWNGETLELIVDPDYHQLPTPEKVRLMTDLRGRLEQLARAAMIERAGELEQLTPAECAVVVGVLRGLTNREIARDSGQAEGTVFALRHRAFEKLGINKTAELAVVLAEQVR